MHFSEYDDRANELKEVFDAYYEGVEENADLSQELRELEDELSKEKRKRQADVEDWKSRNEALQDKIKDCELKNCYQQIYYMDRLLNPPKVEVQEAFTPNRYGYECDVYEYLRRNHYPEDAKDVVLKKYYEKYATLHEEEITEMKKHYEDYKSKKYGPLGKVIMFIVCMYRRFIGKRYEWAIRHFLINDIRREFAREMLDRRWFIASKNGKYTRQILEHNTGEEVIMNYFDQESRQSGRHRIILLIILVFLVGISVSMVYYIRHNSYNGSSRQQTEQPYTSDIYTEAVPKDVSTQDKSIRNEEAHITTEAATETVTTQVPPTQIQSTTTESSTKKEYQIKESSDYDEFQLGD